MAKMNDEETNIEQHVTADSSEGEKHKKNQDNSNSSFQDNSEEILKIDPDHESDNQLNEEIQPNGKNNESDDQAASSDMAEEKSEVIDDKSNDYEEQNLRIRAEFANFKKRIEKEQFEFANYYKFEILKNMLPILDDFKLMFDKSSKGENEQSVVEGAKLIYEKFIQILEKEGLKKIDALGKKFDPEIHEALMMKPIEKNKDNNMVVEIFQDGYKLKDRLLRPSKVIVGKYDQ